MAGHGDPPEGTPEGLPGGDDEYRSVVFDESFIRAARIQELSARERMASRAHAVRARGRDAGQVRATRGGPGQLLALLLLVALAFGAAVFLGLRQPYRPPVAGGDPRLSMTIVPLAPTGAVPGGTPGALLAGSPAAHYAVGGAGIELPAAAHTGDFSQNEVVAALDAAKQYLVASSLDPDVLAGRDRQSVRALLDPAQTEQFDRSFSAPAADGRFDPAGWVVGFDPARVTQVPGVRVHGSLAYQVTGDQALEVVSDHTFVYTLRPAATGVTHAPTAGGASLFVVRRQLRFRFDHDGLRKHQLRLVRSEVGAGPQACSTGAARTFAPLLAGERAAAGASAVVDPFASGHLSGELCGVLANAAEPRPVPS